MAEFNVGMRQDSQVNIVDLNGYLDAHTAPELENALTKLIDERKYNVVVNFEKLSYISSAGLGVFMAFIETMRENKGDIKFCSMSSKIYNIFDLLGFPVLYEFYNDEIEAIKKFKEQVQS